MLSVIIITKNEALHLRACLQSVQWADEIIVVDSGSQDGTQQICSEFKNCHLFEADWPGFGIQKGRALQKAQHEWVLSIDADERITPELKQSILDSMNTQEIKGYYLPRRSQYCGRFIQHSGWNPDYVLRLFQRAYGSISQDQVHERILVNGKLGYLQQPLLHYSFKDLAQVLNKLNHYSSLGAQQLYQRGKKSSISKAILRGIWAFLRTYIIKKGFLDGRTGLMLAISNAEGTYYKYAKLAELYQQASSSSKT